MNNVKKFIRNLILMTILHFEIKPAQRTSILTKGDITRSPLWTILSNALSAFPLPLLPPVMIAAGWKKTKLQGTNYTCNECHQPPHYNHSKRPPLHSLIQCWNNEPSSIPWIGLRCLVCWIMIGYLAPATCHMIKGGNKVIVKIK